MPVAPDLDVHKRTVVACVRRVDPAGKVTKTIKTFATMTGDLLDLSDWLAAQGVKVVAMESTGSYWKPVFNLLEPRFEVVLVNAHHIKQVPGRKTDVKDSEWIAQLLQHGLLRPSFIPPRPTRELRDLTRQRTQLIHERTAVINRIQKVLEDANIKLGSVASNALGVSGRLDDRGDHPRRVRPGQARGAGAEPVAEEDPAAATGAPRLGDGTPPVPAADPDGPPGPSGAADPSVQRADRGGAGPFRGDAGPAGDDPRG